MPEITYFPQANFVYRGDGGDIGDLPCFKDENMTIACYSLSDAERARVAETGVIWIGQLNFGQALQPQALWIDDPFRQVEEGEG